ncbi:hypothetical protein DY000_02057960 [Brassica cretica]|uniref:Uncharacterized protein n=1 Tax=Brassica cretica TaxID=69181 RepID=A0ABQ7ACK6_BRACR|nr:hypothetical protein DY000_02057960 [Brassica cretica]
MVASRIVEFPEDLVEEIDVRCLAGVRGATSPSRIPINVTKWFSPVIEGGRRRRCHETASQSSGPKFVFANLESFGRRRRAHKGWRFPVLLLHQIWFHLSAPWWKVICGGSDLEQREISTSLRRRGFVESGMNTPARDTSESDKGAVGVH